MTTAQNTGWIVEYPDAYATGQALTDIQHGPMVAYNRLGLTDEMRVAARQFDFDTHFAPLKYKSKLMKGVAECGFSISGFMGSAQQRAEAHDTLVGFSLEFLPAHIPGVNGIAETVAHNFSQLAQGTGSDWMKFYWRAEAPQEGAGILHFDDEERYVGIASITEHETTLHADPATYSPSDITSRRDYNENLRHTLRLNPAREAALRSAPQLTMAAWRGCWDMRPSGHMRRTLSTGTRAICIGSVPRHA